MAIENLSDYLSNNKAHLLNVKVDEYSTALRSQAFEANFVLTEEFAVSGEYEDEGFDIDIIVSARKRDRKVTIHAFLKRAIGKRLSTEICFQHPPEDVTPDSLQDHSSLTIRTFGELQCDDVDTVIRINRMVAAIKAEINLHLEIGELFKSRSVSVFAIAMAELLSRVLRDLKYPMLPPSE